MIQLQDILNAHEHHVERRNIVHKNFPLHTIVQLTLAIPGKEKNTPILQHLFRAGVDELHAFLPQIIEEKLYYDSTGPHGLFVIPSEDCQSIKNITIHIENSKPYYRLLDIDVYDKNRKTVSALIRPHGRTCLLCSNTAVSCMRYKTHTADEIHNRVEYLLQLFQIEETKKLTPISSYIGALATQATLYEAAAYPSPGLVDPIHSGSHKDMDFFTFLNSSATLSYYFSQFFQAGVLHKDSIETLLPILRIIGKKAEKAMYTATDKVNTHKGLIFSMALVLGTAGYLYQHHFPLTSKNILIRIPKLVKHITQELHNPSSKPTAGEILFKKFNITGIRGEAESGFPTIQYYGLPILKESLQQNQELRQALIKTLFSIMSVCMDTTILNRQPQIATLKKVQQIAKETLDKKLLDMPNWEKTVWEIDRLFVDKNISPGGSADLLSITYFLYTLDISQNKKIPYAET